MEAYKSNQIEYVGISEYIPKGLKTYKHINVEIFLAVEDIEIEIEDVIKTAVISELKVLRKIKTPVGKSLEGQELTGWKFWSLGELKIRVDYIPKNNENRIYCIQDTKVFSTSIILKDNEFIDRNSIGSVFIEDIYVNQLNEKEIMVVVNLLIGIE